MSKIYTLTTLVVLSITIHCQVAFGNILDRFNKPEFQVINTQENRFYEASRSDGKLYVHGTAGSFKLFRSEVEKGAPFEEFREVGFSESRFIKKSGFVQTHQGLHQIQRVLKTTSGLTFLEVTTLQDQNDGEDFRHSVNGTFMHSSLIPYESVTAMQTNDCPPSQPFFQTTDLQAEQKTSEIVMERVACMTSGQIIIRGRGKKVYNELGSKGDVLTDVYDVINPGNGVSILENGASSSWMPVESEL